MCAHEAKRRSSLVRLLLLLSCDQVASHERQPMTIYSVCSELETPFFLSEKQLTESKRQNSLTHCIAMSAESGRLSLNQIKTIYKRCALDTPPANYISALSQSRRSDLKGAGMRSKVW